MYLLTRLLNTKQQGKFLMSRMERTLLKPTLILELNLTKQERRSEREIAILDMLKVMIILLKGMLEIVYCIIDLWK